MPAFRLFVQFADGTEGLVDMTAFLKRECGIFKILRDVEVFNTVKIENGAVAWLIDDDHELDLAPDRMHDELQNTDIYMMR